MLLVNVTFFSLGTLVVQASEEKPPVMGIDSPTDNYNMYNDLTISGWALNKSEVQKINIYIDNKLIGETVTGLERQDIAKSYLGYPNPTSGGYTYNLKLSAVSAGNHILTVEAIGKDESKSKMERKLSVYKTPIIGPATATKEQAATWAKSKNATDTFISLVDLFWKLAPERGGVDPAIAYAQSALETGYGHFKGIIQESYNNTCGLKTAEGGTDTDPNAHMKFKDWETGIKAHLDHLALYAGAQGYPKSEKDTPDPRHFSFIKGKAPTVESLGGSWAPSPNYGASIVKLANEIKLTKADTTIPQIPQVPQNTSPKMGIESIKDGDIFTSDVLVNGWALNKSGVKSVSIALNDKLVGQATIKQDRQDLNTTYPGYSTGVSYSYTINSSTLSEGIHKITIEATGNDDTKISQQLNIVVKRLPAIMNIEHPTDNITINNSVYISGWAAHASGVKEARVMIDGEYKNQASIEENRKDVNDFYPNYKPAVSFVYSLDINSLSKGSHVVTIDVIGKDLTRVSRSITIKVEKLEPRMWLENTSNQYTLNKNSVSLQGWALNPSGVKEINILVNDVISDKANFMQNRSDVNTIYKGYPTGYGFNYLLDYELIPNGKHTVSVEVVGNDGSKTTQKISVTVNKPTPKVYIEAPVNNGSVKSKIGLSGFLLMDSKVNAINVYANGVLMTKGIIAGPRPDVNKVFSGYNPALHFNADLDITSLKPGIHDITVEVIGLDGSKATHSIKVSKVITYAIDIGHNVNYDYGAVGIKNENDVNMEVGLKVIKKLEDLGYNVINVLPKTATSTQNSLEQRVKKSNENNVDLYVSIHFNKFNGAAKGSEVYTVNAEAKKFAENILKNLESLGYTNRGVKTAQFYVINNATAPSLLVECAFLDSKEDMDRYDAEKIANAIVQGILI